ncbi:23S rRNA (uracil(1939)-C(5))-methyltransferase RlmD [compost metagenome]
MIQTVLNWAGDDEYGHIWDFYSGAGNFTFPLAEHWTSARITGVELNPKLVKRGQAKSRDSRVQFVESDVESFLKKTKPQSQDLVVLDPPRAGASEYIMQALLEARPKKIIYISCHPVSLARDLQWFFKRAEELGIKASLHRVQAFEMFPQTDHVETVVELRVDS